MVAIGEVQGGMRAPRLGHALPQNPFCLDAPNLVPHAVRCHEIRVGRSGHNFLHQGVGLGGQRGIVWTGTQDGLSIEPHRFKKRRKECFTGFQSLFVGFQSTVRAHGEVEVAHHPSPGMCGRRLAVDIPFGM